MKSLKAFIENYENRNGVSQLDCFNTIKLYQSRVESFYSKIKIWLKPLVDTGKLSIIEKEISLTEDSLGTYQIKKMIISFGKFHIELRPIGTILIGTPGRIDMVYNGRTQKFILILENVHNAGEFTKIKKADKSQRTKFVWKYKRDEEQNIYETIENHSFETLSVNLING